MSTELYLDTARLGRMRLRALQAHRDYLRLCAEEGASSHIEQLLRLGAAAWPEKLRRRYPGLGDWGGVAELKRSLRSLMDAAPDAELLPAQRSAELVHLAARALFRRCRRVLHTDLEWPGYLKILEGEASRAGGRLLAVSAREAILRDRITGGELVDLTAEHYRREGCDGLFLSAVSSQGVRFPVAELVGRLKRIRPPRFVVVDGAQAIGHAPLKPDCCDLYLAGVHKWLRGGLPLGIALQPRRESRGLLRSLCDEMMADGELDDPLLVLSRELEEEALRPFGETVNLAPLFTAAAVSAATLREDGTLETSFRTRRNNAGALRAIAPGSGWQPLVIDRALRSGVLLLRSEVARVRAMGPQRLREEFQRRGIALSAYPDGLIRVSMPSFPWENAELRLICSALRQVARPRACRVASSA